MTQSGRVQRLIQDALDRAVDNGEVAGVNMLVVQHGEERWYAEAGMRSIERGEAMTRDTIVRLYSQSKPITGAAAMILAERGLLDLASPVSDYLPGFKGQRVTTEFIDRLSNDIPTEAAGTTGSHDDDGTHSRPVVSPARCTTSSMRVCMVRTRWAPSSSRIGWGSARCDSSRDRAGCTARAPISSARSSKW